MSLPPLTWVSPLLCSSGQLVSGPVPAVLMASPSPLEGMFQAPSFEPGHCLCHGWPPGLHPALDPSVSVWARVRLRGSWKLRAGPLMGRWLTDPQTSGEFALLFQVTLVCAKMVVCSLPYPSPSCSPSPALPCVQVLGFLELGPCELEQASGCPHS